MKRLIPLLMLTLGFVSAQAAPSGVLTIRFLDVGQGDAVLITSPEGKSVVVDGGKSESRMRELIRQYDIQNVSMAVATHADADHITGLIPVVALNKPKVFLNNGLAGTTKTWERLMNVAQQAGSQGMKAADQTFNLGSVKLTVLGPPPGMTDQNTNSVGLLVQYGNFRTLMTGDSEAPETAAWLKKYPASTLGPVQVYKSIHHGASNGDNPAWLAAVRPQNVVISVGADNNYGHPTAKALSLYARAGATVYRTDQQGTVTVTVQPSGTYTMTTEKGRSAAATPTNQTVKPAAPAPAPATGVVYQNCAAARVAGVTPLLRGQPGYSPKLDRDGDGKACE